MLHPVGRPPDGAGVATSARRDVARDRRVRGNEERIHIEARASIPCRGCGRVSAAAARGVRGRLDRDQHADDRRETDHRRDNGGQFERREHDGTDERERPSRDDRHRFDVVAAALNHGVGHDDSCQRRRGPARRGPRQARRRRHAASALLAGADRPQCPSGVVGQRQGSAGGAHRHRAARRHLRERADAGCAGAGEGDPDHRERRTLRRRDDRDVETEGRRQVVRRHALHLRRCQGDL